MKILSGTRDITLLESVADCEEFINDCDRSITVHNGRIYENGTMIAITIRAYQKLFVDIYPQQLFLQIRRLDNGGSFVLSRILNFYKE